MTSKISYFPLSEVALFILALIASFLIYFFADLSPWFFLALIFFAYLATMKEACIVKLDSATLKITSFNPFFSSATINTKSIIKIKSVQTFEQQSHKVYGGSFFRFSRRYELEYLDSKGRRKNAYFSISRKNKEKSILEALNLLTQGA